MIVEAAGQSFKSKTALLEAIRDILYKYDLGAFVGPEDSSFLTGCLSGANVYYGYPAESPTRWRVQEQGAWKGREFVFYRADGTRENPSIRRLSLQKKKGPKEPKQAARNDVKNQILEFRRSQFRNKTFCCADPDCFHSSADISEFEIDHIIPFSELWEYFINDLKISETELMVVEYKDDSGVMINFGLNYPYNLAFQSYHKKHAKLQLLCRACHVAKTRADAARK